MKIVKIRFADNRMYGTTDDGRELWQSLWYYRRLLHATPEQRERYTFDEYGIRWEEIDEDVSFDSFEYDNPEPSELSKCFVLHDELNVSAVARKMGIRQSLLASYIKGTKTPSEARKAEILNTIHEIGRSLCNVQF